MHLPDTVKYILDESRLPTHWYNLTADLPAFNLCGHGHFDMQASADYDAGQLKDH
jgi:predicted alternative tryptophan synthase beta-subunit